MMEEILEYVNKKNVKGYLNVLFRENIGNTFIMEFCV